MPTNKPKTSYYNQNSPRLHYRPLTMDDVESWLPFFDQDDYQRFLGMDITMDPKERSHNWISRQCERQENGEFGQLAVIEKSSNTFIGVGGVIGREVNGKEEFEITYSLFPSHWGNGYATELAQTFIKYAKKNIVCERVISIIHIENIASFRVAEKNGLVRENQTKFMGMPVYIYMLPANKM